MAKFVKGEIVIIPFPFSDLTGSKRRPALVLANLPGDDIILCQVTSQLSPKDPFAIPVSNEELKTGTLPVPGNIRPTRIFTADKNIIIKKIAEIQVAVQEKVIDEIVKLISL